jgi:hypothetical protein
MNVGLKREKDIDTYRERQGDEFSSLKSRHEVGRAVHRPLHG